MAGRYPRTGKLSERSPAVPEVGTKFGHWTFISMDGASRYQVQCCCGVTRTVRAQDVRTGHSTSCGCRGKGFTPTTCGSSLRRKHGTDYGDKCYRAWRNAKNRVANPLAKKFLTYGAAGIGMDPKWFSSFEEFRSAVGEPPSPAHSLDRIDNLKGYVPGNVRWATASEQSLNRRCVVAITFQGVTKPLVVWCEQLGIDEKAARRRHQRGQPPHEVLQQKETHEE